MIDLARQFGFPATATAAKTARIVVVDIDGTVIGMIVDEVPEVLKISEDNIEPTPKILQTKAHSIYFTAIAKLGERLIVMLNISEILAPTDLVAINQYTQGEKNV